MNFSTALVRLNPMLKFYTVVAGKLYRVRVLAWMLAALAVGAFAATLFLSEGEADEAYMLASVALLLWAACLLVIVYTFVNPMPVIGSGDGFFTKVKKRLTLGMRWLMAWVMTLLCVAVVYVSFRAGSLAMQSFGG